MDLTISLANGKITAKVYDKPMALYNYIPTSSVHPPGMNTGLVIEQVLVIINSAISNHMPIIR